MTDLHSRFGLKKHCRLGAFVAVCTLAPPAIADPITLPYEPVTDLRGTLNVVQMFKSACLDQPVTPDLPAQLVPEGYKVVTRDFHLWGEETGTFGNSAAVLSKTETEQGDWDGGFPYVDFTMPSETAPEGGCAVRWQRAWDYADGRDYIALQIASALDAHLSYQLQAFLNSRPEPYALLQGEYVSAGNWVSRCFDNALCQFRVSTIVGPKHEMQMSITRNQVWRGGQ